MKCTPWKVTRSSAGRRQHVRTCGRLKAVIVTADGNGVATIYRDGAYVTRFTAKNLRSAKSAATRRMTKGRR